MYKSSDRNNFNPVCHCLVFTDDVVLTDLFSSYRLLFRDRVSACPMNTRLTVTHGSSPGCVIHSDLCDRRLLDTFVNEDYARVICIRFSPTYMDGWG